MKKIMVLGASILQLPAIIKAKVMGLQTIVIDMDRNAVGVKHADVFLPISTIDTLRIVEAAKEYKVDAVLTLASDMPMRSVAAVAKELGLVGISEDTALKATDKAIMRQCLKDNNVPVPKFLSLKSYDEYLSAAEQLGRFIVKPVDNSGSRGVFLVNDINDKASVLHAYKYSKKYSSCGEIILEEYLDGPEVSVETLSTNGSVHIVAITDKLTTGAPEFVEMGHSQPTKLSEETANQIKAVTADAIKAVGIKNGSGMVEVIVTDDGPKIVEIGARLGGDNVTTHLVPLSTGVDMVKCCIDIALGNRPDTDRKFSKGSAIRYFKTYEGKIQDIKGVKKAECLPGVVEIRFTKKIGDTAGKVNCSLDRVGYVIAGGRDADEAIAICERAMDLVKIELES